MPEAKIKEALIQLHVGIKNSDGPAISAALNQIEALQAEYGRELHPQLQHFLSGRSYAKALTYLGGGMDLTAKPSSPPGGCGGGRS
jgi:hypothetical protein